MGESRATRPRESAPSRCTSPGRRSVATSQTMASSIVAYPWMSTLRNRERRRVGGPHDCGARTTWEDEAADSKMSGDRSSHRGGDRGKWLGPSERFLASVVVAISLPFCAWLQGRTSSRPRAIVRRGGSGSVTSASHPRSDDGRGRGARSLRRPTARPGRAEERPPSASPRSGRADVAACGRGGHPLRDRTDSPATFSNTASSDTSSTPRCRAVAAIHRSASWIF